MKRPCQSLEPVADEIDPRIQYEWILSASPSDAIGTFDGYSFYFYARWDACSFTISRTVGLAADCFYDLADYDLQRTQSPDNPASAFPESLIAAYMDCFHVEREIPGGMYAASYLATDVKKRYIRECCALFDQVGRLAHKDLLPRMK